MGWYPHAIKRPVAYRGLQRRQHVAAAFIHTNGGKGTSLHGWWSSVAARGSTIGAQFQTLSDGTVEQYVDSDYVVYHAFSASTWAVGIEHQDNGSNRNPLTAAQIKATAGILTWLGVPPRILTSPNPAAGVGYHQQFSQFNQSAHDCPGSVRRAQIPAILAAMGGSPSGTGVLGLGDSGPAVAALQRELTALGVALTVDGDFGPATETAVKAFQLAHRLTADGLVGPSTLAAIKAAQPSSGKPVTPSTPTGRSVLMALSDDQIIAKVSDAVITHPVKSEIDGKDYAWGTFAHANNKALANANAKLDALAAAVAALTAALGAKPPAAP